MRGGRIVQAADPQTLYRDPADAAVAGFVDEAVMLEGHCERGRVETALGPLPTRGAELREGEAVTLMLRPEQILCRPASARRPAAPAAECSRRPSTATTRRRGSLLRTGAARRSSPARSGSGRRARASW